MDRHLAEAKVEEYLKQDNVVRVVVPAGKYVVYYHGDPYDDYSVSGELLEKGLVALGAEDRPLPIQAPVLSIRVASLSLNSEG